MKLDKPKSISVLLNEKTFYRMQKYTIEQKLQGNRSFSISAVARELLEKWVDENCPPLEEEK